METTVSYDYGYGGYTLTPDQIDGLKRVVADALLLPSDSGGQGAAIYNYLLSVISTTATTAGPNGESIQDVEPITGVSTSVFAWLSAAAGINRGISAGGDLISQYTREAYLLRTGLTLTDPIYYTASNNIGLAVANGILSNSGALPDIVGLGAADAGAIAAGLFQGVFDPWAGTALFAYLSAPQFIKTGY